MLQVLVKSEVTVKFYSGDENTVTGGELTTPNHPSPGTGKPHTAPRGG